MAPLNVLVVEDSEEDTELELLELKRGGYIPIHKRVDTANAMATALDQQAWDVILCDHTMPHFSAPAALSLVNERRLDVPFVIVSATIVDEVAIAAMKAGARDVIPKSNLCRLVPTVERELRESQLRREHSEFEERLQARFRALIENSSDAICLIDPQSTILYASPSTQALLGFRAEEFVGRHGLELVHPEDRKNVAHVLAELVSNPTQISRTEARVQHKDGSWRWMEAVAKNLLGNPDIQAIVVNYRDISDRKLMEQKLIQAHKLESLGRLAGGVAHDFNNLLTGIMGNVSLMLLSLMPNDPRRDTLEAALKSSERAADLTRQMLAFAGKAHFDTRLMDLSERVEEIANLLATTVPKRINLKLALPRGLPAVEADPSQIQQLVMNLVINAAEAIGDNEGTIEVTTGMQQVDAQYSGHFIHPNKVKPGEYVYVEVHDTGCGMDEETKRKIFDPFFTTKFIGRGLGLAAGLGIVRGHHGAIEVSSSAGEGTTFRVLLPAVAGSLSKPPTLVSNDKLTGVETVLVVDDEDVVRQTAKRALETYGYNVLLAEDGRGAIEIFKRDAQRISVVILDLTMPGISGDETFRSLRAINTDVPILISSGFDEAEVARKFDMRVVAGFIQKPYTAARLALQLKTVLRSNARDSQKWITR